MQQEPGFHLASGFAACMMLKAAVLLRVAIAYKGEFHDQDL